MKKIICLIGAGLLALSAAAVDTNTTSVFFPMKTLTGANQGRGLTLTPLLNPLLSGTNIYAGVPVRVYPSNGVATVSLVPNQYEVQIDGVPKTFTIWVPSTNAPMDARLLTTNMLQYAAGLAGGMGSYQGTFSGALVANRLAPVSTNASVLVVSGAAVAAVNGQYSLALSNWCTAFDPNPPAFTTEVWTNSSSSVQLILNYTNLYLSYGSVPDPPVWTFQDATYFYYFRQSTNPVGDYQVADDTPFAGSGPPDPFFASLSSDIAGLPVPNAAIKVTTGSQGFSYQSIPAVTNAVVYVDPVGGNDSSAVLGVQSLPFKTIRAASAVAPAGSTWVLAPGVHDLGGNCWSPTNATVLASGATILTYEGYNLGVVTPMGSFAMIGGAITNTWNMTNSFGGYGPALDITYATNVYVKGVTLFGVTDVMWQTAAAPENSSFFFEGDRFYGWWDGVTLFGSNGKTNCAATFLNCRLRIDHRLPQGSTTCRVLRSGNLPVNFIGGSIEIGGIGITDTANSAAIDQSSIGTNALLVTGTTVQTPSGIYQVNRHGTVYCPVILSGVACDPAKVTGPLTFTGFAVAQTNSAPSNVTVGSRTPDRWFMQYDTNGAAFFVPAWTAH